MKTWGQLGWFDPIVLLSKCRIQRGIGTSWRARTWTGSILRRAWDTPIDKAKETLTTKKRQSIPSRLWSRSIPSCSRCRNGRQSVSEEVRIWERTSWLIGPPLSLAQEAISVLLSTILISFVGMWGLTQTTVYYCRINERLGVLIFFFFFFKKRGSDLSSPKGGNVFV